MHELKTALNNAQEQCRALHLLMESHFDRMRALLSSHLSVISSQTLDHILHGINAAQKSNAIQCTEKRITTNKRNQDIGAGISICSLDADLAIQQMIQKFFDSLEGPQEISTQVLNLVLNNFENWNPDDNTDQISAILTKALREVQEKFTTNTLPNLLDELEVVFQLTIDIPSKVQVCVSEVLSEFTINC